MLLLPLIIIFISLNIITHTQLASHSLWPTAVTILSSELCSCSAYSSPEKYLTKGRLQKKKKNSSWNFPTGVGGWVPGGVNFQQQHFFF